jgi:hypothetical protein
MPKSKVAIANIGILFGVIAGALLLAVLLCMAMPDGMYGKPKPRPQ